MGEFWFTCNWDRNRSRFLDLGKSVAWCRQRKSGISGGCSLLLSGATEIILSQMSSLEPHTHSISYIQHSKFTPIYISEREKQNHIYIYAFVYLYLTLIWTLKVMHNTYIGKYVNWGQLLMNNNPLQVRYFYPFFIIIKSLLQFLRCSRWNQKLRCHWCQRL